ncbi:MAG: RNA methyltransferase [Muribaculaceae bacterium]|nr:RNA methyltransferase [Muribaculaceae bacterium]
MSKKLTIFDITMEFEILSKSKARELKGLASKKIRDREKLFLAEGEKCVLATLGAFDLELLIASSQWLQSHSDLPQDVMKKIRKADMKTISIFSTLSTPSEVTAVFRKPDGYEVVPELNQDSLYVLLDEIQDPGNLGTIIRTCDWFGVYDIFASANTADVYSPKVVQATMGSLRRVRVHYVDISELIDKNRQLPVIGTLLNGSPLQSVKPKKGGMILLGNEGRGISDNLREKIDVPVTIPPVNSSSHPDSLNVAIANGIVLSHFRKI